MSDSLLWLHELLCGILFWSVFCRGAKADGKVRLPVRLAFMVLGFASCMGMAAPIAWEYTPHPVSIGLLAAFAMVQVVTAVLWADGPPTPFIKSRFRNRRRRSSDAVPMANINEA